MKGHPKQFNSQKTKLKVAAGYSFMLIVFLISVILVYRSFDAIIDSVETMSKKDDHELVAVNDIAGGIIQINNYSTIYTNTFQQPDYDIYLQQCSDVSEKIGQLQKQLVYANIDSIRFYYKEYLRTINAWILLKDISRKNDFKDISQVIALAEDSLTKANLSIPYSSTTIIKETTERKEAAIIEADENTTKSKFGFKKKKAKKSKVEDKKEDSYDDIDWRKTITEISVDTEIDTAYYQQMEELIGKVKETITDTERSKNYQRQKLKTTELKLLETQSLLVSKINYLLSVLDSENQQLISENIANSKLMAENASRQLLYILLICLVVSLIFGHFVFSDISRSSYYKMMLEKEKLATEKLAKAKEVFLTNMSHEIRAPLTNIIGLSEQLNVVEFSNSEKEKLKSIITSSEHLRDIVNDILDLSKIGSGSLKFEQLGFSIEQVIDEVLLMIQYSVKAKELELYSEIQWNGLDPDTTIFLGDPVRLKQLLINLLSNAVKFTNEGFVKLSVNITKRKNGFFLECGIEDTGIGVSQEKLNDIFKDFTQADSAIQRHFGGTGLGLSISKKIVDLQGGKIWMSSEPGKGSVFSFRIPYRRATEISYPTSGALQGVRHEIFKNKKLLVADDDQMVATVLTPLFKEWEIDYTICQSAPEAWELLRTYQFDLLMLDLNMPEMNGYELVDRVKNDESSLNRNLTPIICSGNLKIEMKEGISFHLLPKPFKKSELWNVLTKAVKESAPDQLNKSDITPAYTLANFNAFANEDIITLKIFIETFIHQTKQELDLIDQMYVEKDFQSIGEVAHKLKNTIGQLEAEEVVVTLAHLEKLAERKEFDESTILSHIKQLRIVVAILFDCLEKDLEQLVEYK